MAAKTMEPEVLRPGQQPRESVQPRMNAGGGLFSDENLDVLSKVLDTWWRVPGTNIRFGVDGVVGFIPGVGDVVGGLASCVIVLAAFFRGAPAVTILRMVVNVGVEVLVGMVPVVGNLFDIGWRANRRNYHLLERTLLTGKRDSWRDWVFMGLLFAGLMLLALVPFILLVWFANGILHLLGAGTPTPH